MTGIQDYPLAILKLNFYYPYIHLQQLLLLAFTKLDETCGLVKLKDLIFDSEC